MAYRYAYITRTRYQKGKLFVKIILKKKDKLVKINEWLEATHHPIPGGYTVNIGESQYILRRKEYLDEHK